MAINNTREQGQWYETRVLEYLQQRGLTLVTRNFNCKVGEIDLIMSHQETLVFVEVRARKAGALVDGLNSVGGSKRQRFIKAVKYYLLLNPAQATRNLRFDVVSVSQQQVDWQQNAFDAGGGW